MLLRRPGLNRVLVVTAIGYRPVEVVVAPDQPDPLVIELQPVPAVLDEIGVASRAQVSPGSDNQWVVGRAAVRAVPAAVEPDLFRALALSPAVSFSSIGSSRPLVRGIDADDVAFTLDGHEVVNLYHIGRSFSAFPALLAEEVSVRTQPAMVDVGKTTSGRIEIRGAQWTAGRQSELQYGIGAWTGLTGWRGSAVSAVVGMRTFEGSMADAVARDDANSLAIRDFYGRVEVTRGLPLRLTLFRSTDRGADTDPRRGDLATLDWATGLAGISSDVIRLPWLGLGFSAAYSSRREQGEDVPARRTTLKVDNRISRAGARMDGRLGAVGSAASLWFGAELANRSVHNAITPADPGRFPAVMLQRSAAESGGYLDLETRRGGAVLRAGVRYDALQGAVAWQPRISLALPMGEKFRASMAAGRSARLLHQVSDAGRDPKVAYYDLWLLAGENGVPAATATNATLDLHWRHQRHSARMGIFSTDGEGQVDLIPMLPHQTTERHWRIGRTRVRGAELEASTANPDQSWSGRVSYALVRSERDWGAGWVPWANDRRHQLRISSSIRPFGRTTFSPTLEAATGQPYTPFVGVAQVGRGYREVYGGENSARGRIAIRFGASVEQGLEGPFDSDVSIGVSVTNLGFGDQGPREYDIGFVPVVDGGPLLGAVPASRQVSELPIIPSLLLRVAF